MKGKATDISAYFTSHTPFPRRTSSTTSVVEVVKMSLAKARIEKGQLFSLPTDLLPFIFSFLSSKELCCLDTAILNHGSTYLPLCSHPEIHKEIQLCGVEFRPYPKKIKGPLVSPSKNSHHIFRLSIHSLFERNDFNEY
jgi:hypothetical protein